MRYSTADEAKNEIVTAIEAGGAATRDEYDVDAIFAGTHEWKIDHNDAGQELLDTGGFEQTVDDTEFWNIVAKHEKNPS